MICDALRDLVPILHFKKREKHLCRSITFRVKVALLRWCFHVFKILHIVPNRAEHLIWSDIHFLKWRSILGFAKPFNKLKATKSL